MGLTDEEIEVAKRRAEALRAAGHAVEARYDAARGRVIVRLHNRVELAFPPDLIEELAGASADALRNLEITPAGLGLHWPDLDADLYIPALLEGRFGTRHWKKAPAGVKRPSRRPEAGPPEADGRAGKRTDRPNSARS